MAVRTGLHRATPRGLRCHSGAAGSFTIAHAATVALCVWLRVCGTCNDQTSVGGARGVRDRLRYGLAPGRAGLSDKEL